MGGETTRGLIKLATMLVATAGFAAGASAAEDWTKSKWGPKDEIGAMNLITPASVLAASKLIKTGKTYHLGIIVDAKTPAFPPRTLSLTVLQPNQITGHGLGKTKTTYNDDILMTWLGIGPQIDGLGHIGIDFVHYNGFKNGDIGKATGLTKLGVEKYPPIVARGVVLDMAGYFGKPILPEGTAYSKEDVIGAAKKQGVEIRKGDVVLFHSGWLNLLDGKDGTKADPARWGKAEPGLGKTGAEYLASKEVVAVGADTWGVEAVPFEKGVGVFEIHQILIPKQGIVLFEAMDTRELVKEKAWEFMFVLGAARVRGAVQMIIDPIAIR